MFHNASIAMAAKAPPAGREGAFGTTRDDAAGVRLTIAIFADRPRLREELREEAEAAGFRIGDVGDLAALRAGAACPLADVVVVDCPIADGDVLAGLARLDRRTRNSAADLVISTSVAALDDVFGALHGTQSQILVAPSRAERLVALGRVLARPAASRLRELSDGDRRTLLRLSEQVTRLAERLERIEPPVGDMAAAPRMAPAFRFGAGQPATTPPGEDALVNQARPQLPDPREVRRIIRQRQLRARFFDSDLFADPAWDMLLDLTAARGEQARVSVTSLCIAASVPPTTALRWIGQLTEAGLFVRVEDEADRRRAFIALSDKAADAMAHYFAELAGSRVAVI